MTLAADIQRSKRRKFATPGGFHDALVRFLATALPAGIGLVAAVMILSPLSPRGEISFLLDRNKVAIAPERIRVAGASYRGQDSLGRPFLVSAGSAVQVTAQDAVVQMSDLSAAITLADGPATLTAPDGAYNFEQESVSVTGPVRFAASDGYAMSASGVSIDMKRRFIAGAGGISGSIPAGTFSANRIFADLEGRTFTLDGNARLRMTPGQLRMP